MSPLEPTFPPPDSVEPERELFYWLCSPPLAFAIWSAQDRHFADSTKTVYRAMLDNFVRWLNSRGLNLGNCSKDNIKDFLNYTKNDRQHRRRYVRFLTDVFDRMGELGHQQDNPARKFFLEGVEGKNNTRFFLTAEQRTAIIGLVKEKTESQDLQRDSREYRDAVIVALSLGCGLRAGVVASLTVNCIEWAAGIISVPNYLNTPHEAPIQAFALEALKRWVDGFNTNDKLMPKLSSATIFRSISKFLVESGAMYENDSRLGPQTLRNSYAASLIENGATPAELKLAMGLATIESAMNVRLEYTSVKRGRVLKNPPSPASRKGKRLLREKIQPVAA